MSYCLYREIVHQLTLASGRESYSVYQSPTLTCEEGGEFNEIDKCKAAIYIAKHFADVSKKKGEQ